MYISLYLIYIFLNGDLYIWHVVYIQPRLPRPESLDDFCGYACRGYRAIITAAVVLWNQQGSPPNQLLTKTVQNALDCGQKSSVVVGGFRFRNNVRSRNKQMCRKILVINPLFHLRTRTCVWSLQCRSGQPGSLHH